MRHITIIAILLMISIWQPAPAAGKKAASADASHRFTVVIDAGHGGKDAGAVGHSVREKDVNLAVALKLERLIGRYLKDADVVMTRSNDTFVTLQGRADIANASSGDLFISIHTNSVDNKSKNRLTVNGAAVYVLGNKSPENLAVAQRENSVIMLEDDYTATYQGFDPNSPESYIAFELIQNQHMEHSLAAARAIQHELVTGAGRSDHGVRQAMFWVLVKTGMPAVLVELDFICNPTQARYLSSEAGQTQLAEAIYNGVRLYKQSYDREMAQMRNRGGKTDGSPGPSREQAADEAPGGQAEPAADSDAVIYKVQFMVSRRQVAAGSEQLKGLDGVEFYRDGNSYKYTCGATANLAEARQTLKWVKKRYADAFIIKTRNGKRIK